MGPRPLPRYRIPFHLRRTKGLWPWLLSQHYLCEAQGPLLGGKNRLGATGVGLRAWLPEAPTVTPRPGLPIPKRRPERTLPEAKHAGRVEGERRG